MSYHRYGSSIGDFLKRFREEAQLTQQELAESMKIHRQYISNVEGGRSSKLPLKFYLRLLPHLDPKRQQHLIDLMDENFDESLVKDLKKLRGKSAALRKS